MTYQVDDIHILKTICVPLEESDLDVGEYRNTEIVPLSESAFYQCLITREDASRSLELHDEYVYDTMRIVRDDYSSYSKFISLYEDIKSSGFNCKLKPELTIRILREVHTIPGTCSGVMNKIPVIVDGQHRAAILKYLGYKTIICDNYYARLDRCIEVHK